MSGIAEVLHVLGYRVQGSDASENANVLRLREKGIRIFIGHKAEQIDGAAIVDYFAPLKKWLDEQNQGKPVGW